MQYLQARQTPCLQIIGSYMSLNSLLESLLDLVKQQGLVWWFVVVFVQWVATAFVCPATVASVFEVLGWA